jgi:hypothetical protein
MSLTTVKGSTWNSADNNLAINVKDAPYNAKGDGLNVDILKSVIAYLGE